LAPLALLASVCHLHLSFSRPAAQHSAASTPDARAVCLAAGAAQRARVGLRRLAPRRPGASPAACSIFGLALTRIAQIAVLQTLHYFVLLLLLPLAHLMISAPAPLGFTGGALSVSRLLDWRELVAARQFVASPTWADVWLAPVPLAGVAGTGPLQHVPVQLVARPGPEQGVAAAQTLLGGDAPGDEWAVRGADARRKWAAWLAWSVAGVVE
jgi:hypothetical protein